VFKKNSIRQKQILLSPAFCFTDYKGQGETFSNLIVDFSKPPDRNPLTLHNTYVTLSRLRSSKGLVFLQDITIEDLKKAKYREGALKYMNPEFYYNVWNKSKIQTGNINLKCSVTPKSQPTSWKSKPKPTSSKTPQCP
jgi:hypothetical protein